MRLIFTLYIAFSFVKLFAQDFEKRQWEYANSYFEQEKYFDAITEYKRLLFFEESGNFKFDILLQIGKCYKKGGKFDESIKYFAKSKIEAKNIDEKYISDLEMLKVNILRRTTNRAFLLLDSMQMNKKYSLHEDDFYYWRGWTYIFADEWQNAANEFNKISADHPLKKICEDVENDKYSVTFAKVISYFIPGAGQIYTGNYLSGIMSLGWNVLWGYLTINSFVENRAFDGIAIGGLLWLRFYRGNLQNAEQFAIQKNIEIANRTYRYLKNNYEGIKP